MENPNKRIRKRKKIKQRELILLVLAIHLKLYKREIFIKKYREIDVAINTHEIVCEAIKLMPTLINKSYYALMNWCYRFLKRKGYSNKKVTHEGQVLKEN